MKELKLLPRDGIWSVEHLLIGGLGAALQDFVNIQDWDGAELALGRLRLVPVN